MFFGLRSYIVFVVFVLLASVSVVSSQGTFASTSTNLNMRVGPGDQYPVITVLEFNTVVQPVARNDTGGWILVTVDELRGWAAGAYLRFETGFDIFSLPVSAEIIERNTNTTGDEGASANNAYIGTVIPNSLNVRSDSSVSASRIGAVSSGTQVEVINRNEFGDWVFIRTATLEGWVALGFLRFPEPVAIMQLPLRTAPVPAATQDTGTAPGDNVTLADESHFQHIVLTQSVLGTARNIHQRGTQRGNLPNSFIKIGESNIAGTVYMCSFAWREYNLGDYDYLQPIVDMFNQTSSFCRDNQTAQNGFNTASVLDPIWTTSPDCSPNESPLACEIRLNRPSYAIIYIGIGDMAVLSVNQYRQNLRRILQILSDNGVIPILTTFPMADSFGAELPPAFNTVIRETARQRNLPLIDLRAATWNYDNRGTGDDGYHLSVDQQGATYFTGDEQDYGRTLWELMSLQVLHDLHVYIHS